MRALTHTYEVAKTNFDFHLYEDAPHQWLRETLDQLPSLRCLILSASTLIDHRTLLAVHKQPGEASANIRNYPLRMLDLSKSMNTTSHALLAVLQHCPELVYLDLSSCPGARSPAVLRYLGNLHELKVLNLSHCGLKDEDVNHLSLPRSLLSLNVSFSWITAEGMRKLLEKLPDDNYLPPSAEAVPRLSIARIRHPIFAGNLDKFIRSKLGGPRDTDVMMELPSSFCELDLQRNDFTVGDVVKVLHCPTLDHLDCGTLSILSNTVIENVAIPALSEYPRHSIQQIEAWPLMKSFGNLRSLRIHHSLITGRIFSDSERPERGNASEPEAIAIALSSVEDIKQEFMRRKTNASKSRSSGRFSPSMLPNLKYLALTEVPSKSRGTTLADYLIFFLLECAEEEYAARLDFLCSAQDIAKFPQWHLCHSLPVKLQRLVLEVVPAEEQPTSHHLQAKPPQSQKFEKLTKSSLEDPDAENFMEAAQDDFSFFREESEERLVKAYSGTSSNIANASKHIHEPIFQWTETVSAISAYRRESKAKHDNAKSDVGKISSGHWIGEIQVVRKQLEG